MLRIISNHHKSGTVFWNSVLRSLTKIKPIKIFHLTNKNVDDFNKLLETNNQQDLFIRDIHGLIDNFNLSELNFLGLHSARNAANLIYSGCTYHMKTSEEWANIPNVKFNNLSYKQKINSLNNDQDRLVFEMTMQQQEIKRMFSLIDNPDFLSVDIDKISSDKTMQDLKLIHSHLKLNDIDISLSEWLVICRRHCLWNSIPKGRSVSHITTKNPGAYIDNKMLFLKNSRFVFKELFGIDSYKKTFESNP
jgi:hypothetical protein